MECVSRETNKVMLIRIPESLQEVLKKNPESIGKLSYNTSNKKLELEFTDKSDGSVGNSLKKFSGKIDLVEDDDLFIFSVDGGRKSKLKAKIAYRGALLSDNLSIVDKKNHENINRISEFEIGICDAKIDNKNLKRVMKLHEDHKSFVMANADQAAHATIRKKYKEKRVRGDPQKIKEMLFDLFSHQRYWKTKALADETSQPESFLNEILQEIGDKVSSGQYRGHWQLKSQYRDSDEVEEPELVKKQKLA